MYPAEAIAGGEDAALELRTAPPARARLEVVVNNANCKWLCKHLAKVVRKIQIHTNVHNLHHS